MSRTTRKLLVDRWITSEQHYINREVASYETYRDAIERGAPSYWSCRRWKDSKYDPVAFAEDQLNRWTRDGRDGLTCTGRNTGFKTDAKKTVRRANKSFCRHVLCGDDYEDVALPFRKDGSRHRWDWF